MLIFIFQSFFSSKYRYNSGPLLTDLLLGVTANLNITLIIYLIRTDKVPRWWGSSLKGAKTNLLAKRQRFSSICHIQFWLTFPYPLLGSILEGSLTGAWKTFLQPNKWFISLLRVCLHNHSMKLPFILEIHIFFLYI